MKREAASPAACPDWAAGSRGSRTRGVILTFGCEAEAFAPDLTLGLFTKLEVGA